MPYRVLADAVVLVHVGFVGFVVAGAVLVWRWPRVAWIHVPCALWGIAVEYGGWVCPLTPLENAWRARAGLTPYAGDFIARYLLPVLYPAALTRSIQVVLGTLVLGVNAVVYVALIRGRGRAPRED